MISVMRSIEDPRHPLHHQECAFCRENYDKSYLNPEVSKRAIQEAKGLMALPRLRAIREADHTNKKRLSKLSGVSVSQITGFERGEHMATEDTALRLANALYVTVADLDGTA